MHYKVLVVLMCFVVTYSPNADAGFVGGFLSRCAAKFEPYWKSLMVKSNGGVLLVGDKDQAGEPLVALSLTKGLGAGYFGQVLVLDELISAAPLEANIRMYNGREYEGQLVAKIPHAFKKLNFGRAFFVANGQNIAEWKSLKMIAEQLPQIEKNPEYPQDAAFNIGQMPVAPILGVIRTDRGTILFKPLLKGLFLKDIAKVYRANGDKFPKEMLDGLRDHYQFIAAVYGTNGFSTDIRPPNFLWLKGDTVEEKAQLAFLGYKRPGFITFEMAKMPFNKAHYIKGKGQKLDEFIAEFTRYMLDAEKAE